MVVRNRVGVWRQRTGAEDAVQVVYERHQQDRNVKIVDRLGMSLGARAMVKITEKSFYKTKHKKHTQKKSYGTHICATCAAEVLVRYVNCGSYRRNSGAL